MLIVDGNNVMGSRPDGWWRDRHGAMQRLVDELESRGEPILVVFDGAERDLRATRIEVAFAPHADDLIAAGAAPGVTVITSDRELADRCRAAGADVRGASVLRQPKGA